MWGAFLGGGSVFFMIILHKGSEGLTTVSYGEISHEIEGVSAPDFIEVKNRGKETQR